MSRLASVRMGWSATSRPRAQAAAVHQRPQQPGPRELLQVGARLCEASADALDLPDPERLPGERVERDPGRDDVAPRLFPGEADLVEHLRLDQCQLVTAARGAERPLSRRVPVA